MILYVVNVSLGESRPNLGIFGLSSFNLKIPELDLDLLRLVIVL